PTANAGADQNLTFGTTSTTLTGSGTAFGGRTISSYHWAQTSGNAVSITSANLQNTPVTLLQAGQTYTFTLTVTDNAGATGQNTMNVTVNSSGGYTSLLTGLVSYWKLDELSGIAIDASDGNNGTQLNTTQGVAGKLNNAYSFNGFSSKITMPNASNLSLTSQGSVQAWIKLTTLTPANDETVLAKGDVVNEVN